MKTVWKQLAVVILAFLMIMSGCRPFGKSRDLFGPASPPPPPNHRPENQEEKPPEVQVLAGVELAALKAWEGFEFVLPEPEDSVKKTKIIKEKGTKKVVMVVGDSLSVGIGAALSQLLKNNNLVAILEEGKVSSGLNSPRFYDWYKKLKQLVYSYPLDAIVVIIGGNDAHNGSGSKRWAADYRRKVESFLSIASQRGIQVYWAGLPPMRKSGFSKKVRTTNRIIRSVCRDTGNCQYIDTWDLVADSNGGYARRKNLNGRNAVIRAGDGIHFTFTGYKLLGRHIIDHMDGLE